MDEVLILKLGGSLITDKNKPFSIREKVVNDSIQQIIESEKKLVLIHGGGSFGHPIAKKYNLFNGVNPSVKNQLLGLSETHNKMNELNTFIIKNFLKKEFPAISIQPSSIFIKNLQDISPHTIATIETSLDLGILPVLYGDILFDRQGSFSIISGDRIILELCKNLQKYCVSKAVFAIEEDGIFVKENDNVKLATEINSRDLNDINLADLGQKIDVTGGISGKLSTIKEICKLNIPVQIINGLKEGFIIKALKSQDVKSTSIKVFNDKEESEDIRERKLDHLKIPLEFDVQHSKNYFKDIKLIHNPLPEYDFEEIDISLKFFNKMISAPICISAITGGHPISKEINEILAKAAEAENIIMSVGSQRAGLIDPSTQKSFSIVREVAPNIPVIGNIGIGQLSNSNFKIEDYNTCIEMVKADVMAVHFNALHELLQDKGDISFKLFYKKFQNIRELNETPIIAKEVGTGFNQDLALQLDKLGFDGFDVGGTGGTSFAAIEAKRDNFDNQKYTRNPADVFREWGIPTPISIVNVRNVSNKLIIATGGLRTGIDIAKSIALGANVGGFAYRFLLSAWKDQKNNSITNTIREIKTLKNEFRSCLWLMNLKNISELHNNRKKYVILGDLYRWLNQ